MIKERIDIEYTDGQLFEIKVVVPDNSKPASFTHYLHNHINGVSRFYKKNALSYVKEILEKEYPTEKVTNKVAEEALQYLIFDLNKSVPFQAPKKPKFKFIDLFAGIIKMKQPKTIFFENVKGLKNHDKGKTLATILNVLREDLSVTRDLAGRAFRYNLFALSSQKGFPLQSLTQNAA